MLNHPIDKFDRECREEMQNAKGPSPCVSSSLLTVKEILRMMKKEIIVVITIIHFLLSAIPTFAEISDEPESFQENKDGSSDVMCVYHAYAKDMENARRPNEVDFKLTIYALADPKSFFWFNPPEAIMLKYKSINNKVIVETNDTWYLYRDLFLELADFQIKPVQIEKGEGVYPFPRIYYEIESKGEVVLAVSISGLLHGENGERSSVIKVNDVWVEEDDIFYKVIWPFLPDIIRNDSLYRDKAFDIPMNLDYWD